MSSYFAREIAEEIAWHRESLVRSQSEYLAGVTISEPFRVVLTCEDVPEQWDIFIDDRQVGYLRCRHSRWQLWYPDFGGERLINEPWHPERGEYESTFDEERPAIFQRVFDTLTGRMLQPPDYQK